MEITFPHKGNPQDLQTVDIRTLNLEVHARGAVGFFGSKEKEIPGIGVIDGGIPEFLQSAPDHINLVIDIETGRILNWPGADFLAQGIAKFMQTEARWL